MHLTFLALAEMMTAWQHSFLEQRILLGLVFQVTGADLSTVDYKTDTQKAEEKMKIMEEDSEVDGDIRLQPSSELITPDSLLKHTRSYNYISR